MKVSVAMTSYNGERFVLEQLISLLNQTHQPDEVVIFDDCSQDNTVKIISQFIEKEGLINWHLYINKKNAGFIENFYNAIKSTNGDVIFLCDQDDLWHKDKIEVMLAVLKANPQILVLNTAVKLIDKNAVFLHTKQKRGWCNENFLYKRIEEGQLANIDFSFLTLRNISPGCSICFLRQVKDILLVNPPHYIPHDWFINQLGSLQKGTYFYNKPLTNYRIHQQNTIGVEIKDTIGVRTTREKKEITANKFYKRTIELKTFLEKENREEDVEFVTHYIKFLEKRLSFVKTLSLKDFIGMYKFVKFYHFVFGTRIMLSDFIYLMRLNKILRIKD